MTPSPGSGRARRAIAVVAASVIAIGLVQLTRQPARAALVATGVADSYSVSHGNVLSVAAPGVLSNDLNLLGGATAVLVSGPAHGTLDLRANGSFTYDPDNGYVGTDSFRYRPSGLLSTSASVQISVTNAAPVARADAYTWAGGTLTVAAPGVLANDTDADGDSLSAEMVGGGVSGSLDLQANGAFQLQPGGGFGSSGSFQYRVTDGRTWSQTVTVTLTISAPAPTPTPTPRPTSTPTSTPRPTPTPTPIPLPSQPLPSLPLPSASLPGIPVLPGPTGAPSSASPSAAPTAFASSPAVPGIPRPTQPPGAGASGNEPTATPNAGGVPPVPPSTNGGPGPNDQVEPALRVPSRADGGFGLSLGDLELSAGFETWVVPAATVSGAGLLVLLFALAQAGATVVWVPAVRRLRGERQPRRRRRR